MDTPWWSRAWPTKAEQADIIRRAKENTPDPAAVRAARIAYLNTRTADGLRRSPQTAAEQRVWHELDMYERGRNGHMPLGDIIIQLNGVAEELDNASGDARHAAQQIENGPGALANGLGDGLPETRAAIAAGKERAESAEGTLLAATGSADASGMPDSLADAYNDIKEAQDRLDKQIEVANAAEEAAKLIVANLAQAKSEVEKAQAALARASKTVSEYAAAITG